MLLLFLLLFKLSSCTDHDIEIIDKAPCIEWLALPQSYDGLNCPNGILGFPFGYYEGIPAITVNLQDESTSEKVLDMHKFLTDGDITGAISLAPTEEGAIARTLMGLEVGISEKWVKQDVLEVYDEGDAIEDNSFNDYEGYEDDEVHVQKVDDKWSLNGGGVVDAADVADVADVVENPIGNPLLNPTQDIGSVDNPEYNLDHNPEPNSLVNPDSNPVASPVPNPIPPEASSPPKQFNYHFHYNQLSNCTQALVQSATSNKTISQVLLQWDDQKPTFSYLLHQQNQTTFSELQQRGFFSKFNPFSKEFGKFYSSPDSDSDSDTDSQPSPSPYPQHSYYMPPQVYYSLAKESFGPNFTKTKSLLSLEMQCSYKDGISLQEYKNFINFLSEPPPTKGDFNSTRVVISDGISALVYYPEHSNSNIKQTLPNGLIINAITISAGEQCWPEFTDTSVSSYIKFQNSRIYIVKADSMDKY